MPKPGRPVRGSSGGRPLMAALDLFGRRWTLRIVWKLQDAPLGFRTLQQRCDDMSSSVLRHRLLRRQGPALAGAPVRRPRAGPLDRPLLIDAGLVHQTPRTCTP
ncbi:hypothetical protein AB0C84_27175 [Actinomadura sp. NPDC048955]|uniref:winged helix-turn-helix transcriptional regulator n=1 Tax=Actinomadura sp. NPDC048955 TaxID=3158228 RepID=UPI00340D41A7